MRGVAPTTDQRTRFLDTLAKTANVTASSAVIGLHRNTMYQMRESDPDFAEAWENAIEQATDALEQACRNRAIDGVPRYVVGKNGLILDKDGEPLTERTYSDTLAIALLKAHRRDKFGDQSKVDMNVKTNIAELIEEGRLRARGET